MDIRFAITCFAIAILPATLRADDKEVQTAIKAGQKYLLMVQRAGAGGGLPGAAVIGVGGNGRGGDYLTGLALIESGLPADSPIVAGLAKNARQSIAGSNATYEISLAIMFLDRVGAKEDRGLIQYLTLKLMSGQCSDGSWSYTCDGLRLDPVQEAKLLAELTKESRIRTPDTPPPSKKEKKRRDDDFDNPKPTKKNKPEPKKETPREEKKDKLHPALEEFAKSLRNRGGFAVSMGGDHSNTQFATVGLWCGRRHGVDVSDALTLLDKHYRSCQNQDGGWTYSSYGGPSSPAMACAGLMGLAMGFGAKDLSDKSGGRAHPEDIAKDKAVEAGLKYVGDFIAAAGAIRGPGGAGGAFQPNELSNNLYFMWSLERVGMVYGLKTIGTIDWYDWGSKILVKTQQRDGSWPTDGFHSGTAENSTAFALLFLSRANLAEDLTTSLKGKVRDPGTSRLRSGGDLSKLLEGAGKGSSGSKGSTTTRPKEGASSTIGVADKAGRMAATLVAADATQRAELLKEYRDTKGGEYTDALARAASKMSGEPLAQVREALAQRLTRMTAATLNDLMRDRDRELRRAAALAVGAKGKDRLGEFAKFLIPLVADDDPMVSQAARASLKSLTDQDFGPDAGAGPAERGKAFVAWRNWWEKQE